MRLRELAELPRVDGWQRARSTLISEHEAALERLRQRFETRFEALERVARRDRRAARGHLAARDARTRAGGVVRRVRRSRRAILSLVKGGRMVAEAAFFAGADGGR